MDGARFTRQSTYCILSFAILSGKQNISSEGKRCNLIETELLIVILTITDLHTVAIIKAEEKYENLKEGFANCFNEINQLIESPGIQINGVDYELIFYLCSDYKACNTVTVFNA